MVAHPPMIDAFAAEMPPYTFASSLGLSSDVCLHAVLSCRAAQLSPSSIVSAMIVLLVLGGLSHHL